LALFRASFFLVCNVTRLGVSIRYTRRGGGTIVKQTALALLVASLLVAHVEAQPTPSRLSFEQRVEAQRAIEQVLWNHRIWPPDNPEAKPPLSEVIPDRVLRLKVEASLENSKKLAETWRDPINEAALETERKRIIARSGDLQLLQEIFDALGNDPVVIDEALVRPILAERRIREKLNPGEVAEVVPATPCAGDSLSPTSTAAGVPSPRFDHTAVWTGAEMIVWGGWFNLNTGGRYTPATDSWQPTSTTGAPAGRQRHVAIWTGTEMIVWGGNSGNGVYPAAGGRYNPASDTWTTTATLRAPPGRELTTAVWTGSLMIVWGGFDGVYHRDGARYNPTSDSWSAVALTGAPWAYVFHTAVWTGTEMIVLGGGLGGRYDPATGLWSGMSNSSNRIEHTAVWTGTEMLVWGGVNQVGQPAPPGERYDPVTDSWAWMSTLLEPSPPAWHTAVWTGTQMIVTHGNLGASAYTPASDSWHQADLQTQRAHHSAVWTGDRMILWGGYAPENVPPPPHNAPLSTGVQYCPCEASRHGYYDADHDGYGLSPFIVDVCGDSLPEGYAPQSGDCNDSDPGVHPGAQETCNGTDDDCDLGVDEGFQPPTTSPQVFASTNNATSHFTWLSVPGADTYDVVKGSLSSLYSGGGDFTAATTQCLLGNSGQLFADDAQAPSGGHGFWYLVRPKNCGAAGTYDDASPSQSGSRDAEIAAAAAACP
jgi:hypothetical protein